MALDENKCRARAENGGSGDVRNIRDVKPEREEVSTECNPEHRCEALDDAPTGACDGVEAIFCDIHRNEVTMRWTIISGSHDEAST
jgi:hypothetical protein